jgi:hypothetical protein
MRIVSAEVTQPEHAKQSYKVTVAILATSDLIKLGLIFDFSSSKSDIVVLRDIFAWSVEGSYCCY